MAQPSNTSVHGEAFEAGAGQSRPALLRRTVDGSLAMVDEASQQNIAYARLENVTVSSRVGKIPRRVTFPDGSIFSTQDNDGIDALVLGREKKGFVTWLETPHPRLIAVAAIAILMMFGVFRYGLPVMVEGAVAVTPDFYPKLLAEGSLRSMDATVLNPSELDEAQKKEVSDEFGELVAAYLEKYPDREDVDFKLLFRSAPAIGPNAFALPDGTIVITDQIVKFTRKMEHLTGVLAHEIAHVHHKHSLRQIYRSAGVAVLILFISGDLSQLTEDLLVQGSALYALSHSRDMETQADDFSITLMRSAGKDPSAIGGFFRRLREECKSCDDDSWLSTHPGLKDRIDRIEELSK